jgi:hypothetical protein
MILQHVHAKGAAGLAEACLIEPDGWDPVAEATRAGSTTADPAPVSAPDPKSVDVSADAIAA